MEKHGDLYTPFKDAVADAPGKKETGGASFGTPMSNAKPPTEGKLSEVQFDTIGGTSKSD